MTAAPAQVMAVRCNYCSKQRPPHRAHRLSSNQVICDHCLDWHYHAIEFLGGGLPRGCQQCGVAWATLRDSTPGDEIRMYVVPKDGIYQLLCRPCVKPYTAKRADLYGGTKFGSDVLNL